MPVYGWAWVDGEDDQEGDWWITIEPLVVEGGHEVLSGDEMATILCRDYERVKREHPEWIEAKETTAKLIVNALNLREDVLDRMAEGFEFPGSTTEVAQEIPLTQDPPRYYSHRSPRENRRRGRPA